MEGPQGGSERMSGWLLMVCVCGLYQQKEEEEKQKVMIVCMRLQR